MFYINSVKKFFYKDLEPVLSVHEISSIWNQWVVKEVLGMSLVEYFSQDNFLLQKVDFDKITLLVLHLLAGQPIQYFFGYTYFKGLKISVDSNVLIPRPETEELIDLVVMYAKQMNVNSIIDVGVGSGCVSIALKKIINAKCTGVDYCDDILNVAVKNAKYHNVSIDFMLIDILNDKDYHLLQNTDIIVSNPPYVIKSDVPSNSNILFEPEKAIFVNKDNPLVFFESICRFANKRLNVGGKIFFEINPKLVSELSNLIISLGYSNIKIHTDFYDKKRFIVVSS